MKRNKVDTVYVYPNTPALKLEGSSKYMGRLMTQLNKEYRVINKPTSLGLFDLLMHLPKTNIVYFNWIEELPHRRFWHLQFILLPFILAACKLFGVRIVWFIHNNFSHSRKNRRVKQFIYWMMKRASDLIVSHSSEGGRGMPARKFCFFDHPLEEFQPVQQTEYAYDLLMWGAISPYKGVRDFIDYMEKNDELRRYRILIAGKFYSEDEFMYVQEHKTDNIILDNRIIPDNELLHLFARSRYVLFTYRKDSILCSGAFVKTLAHGKEVIAPSVGSFKDLAAKKFVHTYDSFAELGPLLSDLENGRRSSISLDDLSQYIRQTSWNDFGAFLNNRIGTN